MIYTEPEKAGEISGDEPDESRGSKAPRQQIHLVENTPHFQPGESLKAMVYFEDGDLHTLTKTQKSTLVTAVSAVRDLPHVTLRSTQLTADLAAR